MAMLVSEAGLILASVLQDPEMYSKIDIRNVNNFLQGEFSVKYKATIK
jgi:hypothetical protein